MGYAVNTTGTSLESMMKIAINKLGLYDHTYKRGYMKFSITSPPFTLAQIDSVTLKVYVTTVSVTASIPLKSDINTDNWGATLTAAEADWNSTDTEAEDTISISSTGYKTFSVDKNNLNLNGYTYFRLGLPLSQSRIIYASQDHGTSGYRPLLIVTYTIPELGVKKVAFYRLRRGVSRR